MRIAGMAIRTSGERFVAGFVLVQENNLVKELSLNSPGKRAGPEAFSMLNERALDFLEQTKPDVLALCPVGLTTASKKTQLAHRAEGAILAAAGARNLETRELSRQDLGKAAGIGTNAKTQEAVTRLCELLDPAAKSLETQRAAAAARAAENS